MRIRSLVAASMLLVTTLTHAADAPLFAAPHAQGSASASDSGTIGQVTLALAIVLALVFVAAWGMRHLRKLNLTGGTQPLQVVSQVTLGPKERAVLIRIKDQHILVGVAPGQVTALHTFVLAEPIDVGSATTVSSDTDKPTFQSLLKKSLGMK